MNERGYFGEQFSADDHHAPWGDSLGGTSRFTPVSEESHTAVGVLERPEEGTRTERPYPAQDHPSFPPGALSITPQDLYEILGPDVEDLMADTDLDVEGLIGLLNAETTVMPPLPLSDSVTREELERPSPELSEAISTWKRRFLKSAVAALILSITGAGGAAAAMDKSVTVEVDGKEREVSTYESTVGEVLEDEGIEVDKHDALSPSLGSKIEHGETITLDRGRKIELTVDGRTREEWVRSVTVGQALRQLGVPTDGASISAKRTMPVPEEGMSLEVKTAKSITLVDGGNKPRQLTTTAVTIDELLRKQGLQVDENDKVTPGSDQRISDGAEVRIDRTGISTINVREEIDPPVKEIVDDSMLVGERKVEQRGEPGEKIVFTRVTTHNGEEVKRETVGEKVVTEAEPKVVRVGGKQPPNSGVWDKLAECESGGNWHINTGNGYYGGVQFNKSTWDAYGGDQYAAYPHQASREQQIAIATKVRDARGGYGAWPSCSAQLGLS
ncbi:Uncharacterized conserved protein YabE, contains G5 and tandem DUF348 domains [Actinopolyspora xinjiangensis]|uniref:Uncharacterized conserved protein YabE, contains G5 and tandem DUF348 domains n=1 Tax=Actinopolyspora xinjiangensis TaxID=405564 RepID=A0A1H0QH33_9ACTN|nr:resuscitation-promoting factor [Actinopolyspora xinjiangensis]SDP16691.1 Uncharacterized conserved protein YabE, contains G5 and tandem DUF348 domains [Actinopolyspora xinjiangensis]